MLRIKKDEKKDTKIKSVLKGAEIVQPVRHKFLGPGQKPKKNESNKEWVEYVAKLQAIQKIIPLLLKRYPEFQREFRKFQDYLPDIMEFFRPAVDDRYNLTLYDWFSIIQNGEEYGYRKAVRDASFLNINGKKLTMSHVYVKRKRYEIMNKGIKLATGLIAVERIVQIFQGIVEGDKVVKTEFNKWFNHYQNTWYGQNDSYYRYKRYYIRHPYDSKIYAEQKKKYETGQSKSKPSGRVECGPFDYDKLPRSENVYPN